MAVNKVVYGNETLIDLTEDTATADTVADGYTIHLANGTRATGTAKYAASATPSGSAIYANAIHYGAVDSTSTSKVFTATIPGITELYDGLTVMLYNGVITSASGYTININGLGAHGTYSNMTMGNNVTPTDPTRDTTIFNINYAMLMVYCTNIGNRGVTGWICYRGYDANTNTIGYQLRTNSTVMTVSDTARYYKLYFTSADGNHWVPASVNSTNNATSVRPVNQRPIDPFGRIVYTSASTNYTAGSNLAATTIWDQYALVLGYSFNRTGAELALATKTPVYIKCAPQSDGSAIIDADTPYVQALPSTADGKIYIYLGVAYDATHIELFPNHPVYYYSDGAIRLWTNGEASANITVDSALSSTSENPVQNKVINAALGNKASAASVPNAASIDSSGLITFKHGTTSLFTLQLPIYVPPSVALITFTMPDGPSTVECNAEEGMTFAEWLSSEYYTGFSTRSWAVSGTQIRYGDWVLQLNGTDVHPTDEVQEGAVYGEFFDD